MPARLVPLPDGKPIELGRAVALIGRGEACDVRITDPTLSKRHCVLAETDGMVLVRDLGSKNGVRVNGKRVRRGVLFPGDQLSVADYHFKLALGDPPTASLA